MDISVHINNVKGSQMAAKITGTFTISDHAFKFSAIAFGRIGGHNIGAKISKTTEKELKKLGHDPNEVIDILQKNLISGNITLPEGLDKESFADT
ncbi:MAG: hypothetical protein EB150_01220 [Nitrososphaeria archaeon]|nr:hypothetical protein [Nitrososphaeria archaeon]NDB89507.1 hypothetical protein [Nitrososphaerota archaeon]NDF27519.1 hypothetical protein [Nitrosopumilaceae archaeon]NDB45833.1 hypothetical protein [Nitrososphaeria archaeon]NDB91285.1 hypothetical protein [Nitrososphaeria archaeon]